jgi:hypothetical protein
VNSQQAKEILQIYRPGHPREPDPQVEEALEQTRRDPELRLWFEQQSAFHEAMAEKFRQIPVPPHLKEAILAANKVVPLPWWRSPVWLTAAAVFLLLLAVSSVWFRPGPENRFAGFRSRMVRTAELQYRMDILTNDLQQVRQFLARRGAPADFPLSKELEKLPVTGGRFLRWHNNPVSMVCFDRGDQQMLFLFVVNRAALLDAPPQTADVAKVSKLLTSSWTQGDKAYLLAGPDDSALLRKQL